MEASVLTITPPMQFFLMNIHTNLLYQKVFTKYYASGLSSQNYTNVSLLMYRAIFKPFTDMPDIES